MPSRLELHQMLCCILGSEQVYFQPPSNVTLRYPAIVYSLDEIGNVFADNVVYNQTKKYSITVIDKNPESDIVVKISKLPTSRHNTKFEKENLNHNVFTIHY